MNKTSIKKNVNTKSKLNVLIIALIIFSIFGIVFSIGKYISAPWDLKITTDSIVSQQVNDNFGIVVDEGGSRLSILNKNKEISDIKSYYSTDSNLYFYNLVCFNDDYYFVNEYSYYKDTQYRNCEKIVQYNLDGTKVDDLVTYSYDLKNNFTNTSNIKNLYLSNDALYYTYYDAHNNIYSINSIDLNTKEVTEQTQLMQSFPDPTTIPSIYTIAYNHLNEKLLVVDTYGDCYTACLNDSSFKKEQENIVYTYNNQGINQVISRLNNQDNNSVFYEGDSINYSVLLLLRILYFWLSILLLVIIVSLIFYSTLKNKSKKSIAKKIKTPLLICLCAVVGFCVIAILNKYSEVQSISFKDDYLKQNVLSINESYGDEINKLLTVNEKSNEYKTLEDKISKIFQQSSLTSARSNLTSNLALYKLKDNSLVSIVNSTTPSLMGIEKSDYNPPKPEGDYGIFEEQISMKLGNYRVLGAYIHDSSNNVIGAITCYGNIDTTYNLLQENKIALMIAIASGLIVISFLLMEGARWCKSFIKRKKRIVSKETSITSPLFFMNIAASSADTVLGVLVFSDMLIGTVFEGNMLMISLPLTAKVVGKALGVVSFPKIIKRLGTKHTVLIASFISFICLCLNAVFIFSSLYFLLLLSMFFAGFFREYVWMYLNDIPTHIKDSNIRKEINNNTSASSICGSALITIIAGYVSDTFGGWSVYMCAAVPALICFIMILILLPKVCYLDNDNNISSSKFWAKDVTKFIFRPDVLLLMFSSFGLGILISGYKGFIFPLISTMNGFSNSDVSNISVFANALVFYITPLFTIKQKHMGTIKMLFSLEFIIGFIFVMFAFNSSFLWACIVYFVAQTLNKLMYPSANDCWQTIAINTNTDSNTALTGVTLTNNIFELFKNTTMGALMSFGSIFACIFIGVYSLVSSSLFAAYFKNRNVLDENNTFERENDKT